MMTDTEVAAEPGAAAKPSEAAKPTASARPGPMPKEIGGTNGPEPTRYGDWEHKGRCSDF
jgi:hypothetical protein